MHSVIRNIPRLMRVNRNLCRHERLASLLAFDRCPQEIAAPRPMRMALRPITASRSFSTQVKEGYVKLSSQDFRVSPGFGTVEVRGDGVDYVIKPASPQEYPDADRAFVSIYGLSSSSSYNVKAELLGEKQDMLSVTSLPASSRLLCEIEVPIKYDINVDLKQDANLQILNMEADEVDISTEYGEVATRGLKSHNIRFKTQTGNISSEGTLQGNIYITAKSTHLKAKRLQGLQMNIVADELKTNVQSSYMNRGQITVQRGDLVINHLHGSTSLSLSQGNLSLSGLHGHLTGFVGSGNVDVQLMEVTEDSSLKLEEGKLTISVLDQPRHNLHVTAPSLDISEDILSEATTSSTSTSLAMSTVQDANTFSAEVKKGTVKVQRQDWFSTLGIKIGG